MNKLNWPSLPYREWSETCTTIHLWTQILGKIRVSKTPWTNHSWNSTLYVTAHGLSTGVIHDKDCSFSMELDFLQHQLKISRSDGPSLEINLPFASVSAFYETCHHSLKELGIDMQIHTSPNELEVCIPFDEDKKERPYDKEAATRFWYALLNIDRVFKIFRSRFLGKASPVHFFWGSFDLAATRFSGKLAPKHAGGVPHLPDVIACEAYSRELSSCGFWPGNEKFPHAAFYCYAYPTPKGFEKIATVPQAYFEKDLGEFILLYDDVIQSEHPEELLLNFLQSTYEGAANLGHWDRDLLEECRFLKELQEDRSFEWRGVSQHRGQEQRGIEIQ